jgi:hypothetical protein
MDVNLPKESKNGGDHIESSSHKLSKRKKKMKVGDGEDQSDSAAAKSGVTAIKMNAAAQEFTPTVETLSSSAPSDRGKLGAADSFANAKASGSGDATGGGKRSKAKDKLRMMSNVLRKSCTSSSSSSGQKHEEDQHVHNADANVKECVAAPPSSREEKTKKGGKAKGKGAKQHQQPQQLATGFDCAICAAEDVEYVSFGKCNHHVCSLCSLRLRFKCRDFACSICKQDLDVMVVCAISSSSSSKEQEQQKKGAKVKILKKGEKLPEQPALGASQEEDSTNKDDEDTKKKKNSHKQQQQQQQAEAETDVVLPTWESLREVIGSGGAVDVDETLPGVDNDPSGRLKYVRCTAHFQQHTLLRSSTSCFVPKCKDRFRTEAKLLQHLEQQHSTYLCHICVEGRPFFLTEHRIMKSAKEVKKHVCEDPTSSKSDKLGGHPECRFCHKHYFDASALYSHMVSVHQNCPLCPQSHQFRFYQTTRNLDAHIRKEHLVCEQCYDLDRGELVAFSRHSEYEEHMSRVHRVRNVSLQSLLAASSGSYGGGDNQQQGSNSNNNNNNNGRRGRTDNNNSSSAAAGYVELDMNSRDPNEASTAALLQSALREANQSSASAFPSFSEMERGLHSIPDNMRVAGQIVGGQLRADVPGALALQEASNAYTNQRNSDIRRQNRFLGLESRAEAFPSLSSSSSSSSIAAAPPAGGGPKLHAMSLVNKQREQAAARREHERAEAEAKQERDRARLLRATSLAEGFGVAHSMPFLLGPTGSLGTRKMGNDGTMDELKCQAQLCRPLYTEGMLAWGRNNRHDVLLTERRLMGLLEDPSPAATSVQLKPMPSGQRMAAHQLARYYACSSYEYDHEPRRYVSIVRTADSVVPSLLLSQALDLPAFPVYPALRRQQIPVLYFGLLNGFYGKLGVNLESGSNDQSLIVLSREDERDGTLLIPNMASSSAGKKPSGGDEEPSATLNRIWIHEAGISASQLCGYLASATRNERGISPIVDLRGVEVKGASCVMLTFGSLEAADACAGRLLEHYQHHKLRLRELAANKRVPVTGRAHVLDLFEMELGFTSLQEISGSVEPAETAGAETVETAVAAVGAGGAENIAAAMQRREKEKARLQASVLADWGESDTDDADADDTADVYVGADAADASSDKSDNVKQEQDPRFNFDAMRAETAGERKPLALQPRTTELEPPLLPPFPPSGDDGGDDGDGDSDGEAKEASGGISLYKPPRNNSAVATKQQQQLQQEQEKEKEKESKRAAASISQHEEKEPAPRNLFEALESDSEEDEDEDEEEEEDDGEHHNGSSSEEREGEGEGEGEGDQWQCQLCTYLNSPFLTDCEMCGAPH